MLRAVMEAVAYNLRWCYESMEHDLGQKTEAVRILGGGTKSKIWMQMFADIFNRKIEVVKDTQIAGAIGGAFAAAIGLGMYHSYDEAKEWAKISAVYTPNQENAPVYEESFVRFKDSYDAVKDIYHKWNGRQENVL